VSERRDWLATHPHLAPAPRGIGACAAWSVPGGRGEGVRLAVVEGGWDVRHPALVGLVIGHLGGEPGPERRHGTRMLSVVASPGVHGQIGVAPRLAQVWVRHQAQHGQDDLVGAIGELARHLRAGDVLLIEAQLADRCLPVCSEPRTAAAIGELVVGGVLVVVPAGNGGLDLDAQGVAVRPGVLVVGAASARWPRRRMAGSNHGEAVRVHAWGERVATAGPAARPEATAWCGGTSAAAAVVAGAACVVQGAARACGGAWAAEAVAALLADPVFGTPSEVPERDRIGVMPDLERAVTKVRAAADSSAVEPVRRP
jgi:serine protease